MPRRVIGAMTPHPPAPARDACARTAHWNLGDPDSYPEMVEAKHDLLERFSQIVLGYNAPAEITSGASESNLLALLYWRQQGKKRVLATPDTHYSVRKAAYTLGLTYTQTTNPQPASEDVIVATIGKTEYGTTDPVPELYEKAVAAGAGLHVDAAYAGTLARAYNPRLLPRLDETLATVTVDLHKIPESPPPAGVLFAYDPRVLEILTWPAPYIPSGRQFGILGTRPGCVVAAASLSLRIVVEEHPGGPAVLLEKLNRIVDAISRSLQDAGYEPVGGPFPVRCLFHPEAPRIIEHLTRRGVGVYRCGDGRGVRIVGMPHLLWEGYEWIVNELRAAALGGGE